MFKRSNKLSQSVMSAPTDDIESDDEKGVSLKEGIKQRFSSLSLTAKTAVLISSIIVVCVLLLVGLFLYTKFSEKNNTNATTKANDNSTKDEGIGGGVVKTDKNESDELLDDLDDPENIVFTNRAAEGFARANTTAGNPFGTRTMSFISFEYDSNFGQSFDDAVSDALGGGDLSSGKTSITPRVVEIDSENEETSSEQFMHPSVDDVIGKGNTEIIRSKDESHENELIQDEKQATNDDQSEHSTSDTLSLDDEEPVQASQAPKTESNEQRMEQKTHSKKKKRTHNHKNAKKTETPETSTEEKITEKADALVTKHEENTSTSESLIDDIKELDFGDGENKPMTKSLIDDIQELDFGDDENKPMTESLIDDIKESETNQHKVEDDKQEDDKQEDDDLKKPASAQETKLIAAHELERDELKQEDVKVETDKIAPTEESAKTTNAVTDDDQLDMLDFIDEPLTPKATNKDAKSQLLTEDLDIIDDSMTVNLSELTNPTQAMPPKDTVTFSNDPINDIVDDKDLLDLDEVE